MFPVLRDTELIKTDFGQKLLIITMIGEILTLAGLTIFTIISKYGYTINSARQILYLAVFFIVIYLFMKILKAQQKLFLKQQQKQQMQKVLQN